MEKIFSKENNFIKIMREDYKWILPIVAAIPVCLTAILKFIEYIHAISYTNYYGIDIEFYNFYSKSFMYSLLLSIIYMIPILLSLYAIWEMKNIKKIKKGDKLETFFFDLILTLIVNSVASLVSMNNFDWITFIVLILVSYFIEYVCVLIIEHEEDEHGDWKKYIFQLTGAIFILVVILSFKTFGEEMLRRSYRMTSDDRVVIYVDTEYYLTMNCEISDGNKLIIYKGTQTKIDSLDVMTKLRRFDSVEVASEK